MIFPSQFQKKTKILLVDDDKISLQILEDFITDDNFEIYKAENGLEALEIQYAEKVDLIITDLVMPEMEGIELLLSVKKRYPDVKIIAISGKGNFLEADYLSVAKELGANYVLTKPIEKERINKTVKLLLN
ncbi:MAG: response regulator [Chlorobi bacterium]|nr:response regulator [Chlorobiota bacterium]